MIKKVILAAAALALLTACSAPSPELYANEQPSLDLKAYFNGPMTAHGMFQDRSGKVVKRFVVTMRASWNGDTGILDEHFRYSDGTTQQRTWTIRAAGQGRYTATAADVVGPATGRVAGNALQWNYVLALPVDGRVVNVTMDDWMFLIDDKVLLNRTRMSKFGVHLGDVILSITKP
jgi:hypothetical protein